MKDRQVFDKKSEEEPDLKRQKPDPGEDDAASWSSDDSRDPEDVRLYEEELARSGEYDFDSTRVGKIVVYYPVRFEESRYTADAETETDGDLVERLSKWALDKYNHDESKSLEFVRATKDNWSLGGGHVFSITFEAKDSDSHIIPFQATVIYLPGGSTIHSVRPKP